MKLPPFRLRDLFLLVLVVTVAGLAIGIIPAWQKQREWFLLQSQQRNAIDRLEDFPPPGCDPDAWRNEIVTLHNVWGNVTFRPSYSEISNAEMRILKSKLDEILRETSRDSSVESVDQVYGLLMERGKNTRFIAGYREEFRTLHIPVRQGSTVEPSVEVPSPVGSSPNR